jgi:kynurenine formamidase
MLNRITTTLIVAVFSLPASALDISEFHLVDLSHSYGDDTLYWPTAPSRFEKTVISFGETESGGFYSAFSICTPEHGGTHLDAPMHFARDGLPTERIPLENLIAPAVVIDVSKKATADRNYLLGVDDVLSFEEQNGRIEPGTIILLRTGWSKYWPDSEAYMGEVSKLEFPSYGEDAARLLVENRKVAMLGVDTASTDFGTSEEFVVHRIAAENNVSNLENLTNLDKLPQTGALIIALPMKIEGGSGGPVRVVALVPRTP